MTRVAGSRVRLVSATDNPLATGPDSTGGSVAEAGFRPPADTLCRADFRRLLLCRSPPHLGTHSASLGALRANKFRADHRSILPGLGTMSGGYPASHFPMHMATCCGMAERSAIGSPTPMSARIKRTGAWETGPGLAYPPFGLHVRPPIAPGFTRVPYYLGQGAMHNRSPGQREPPPPPPPVPPVMQKMPGIVGCAAAHCSSLRQEPPAGSRTFPVPQRV